jgi:hypothetical protein
MSAPPMEHGEYQQVIIQYLVINNFVMEIGFKSMINGWTFCRTFLKARCLGGDFLPNGVSCKISCQNGFILFG